MNELIPKWTIDKQSDGSVVVMDERGDKVLQVYPPDEQIRYFLAMINALSGYTVDEVEGLAEIRAKRDARVLGLKP